MKNLSQITQDEVDQICLIIEQNCLRFYVNENVSDLQDIPTIQIVIKDITNGDRKDEVLYIYATGKVTWIYNDGNWGGSSYNDLNALPITDYLRAEGYKFKY